MKILVVGSGGREHAICWRLSQSQNVELFAMPGNPGIARVAQCLPSIDLSPAAILRAARSTGAELTVIGPEAPLVAGVVDAFRAAGLPIVGPTAEAAQLEGSKVFAKQFFAEHGIPTAAFVTADTRESARAALDQFSFPLVVKADGLAAGKGVVIAKDRGEAERAIDALGPKVVIEEFLQGKEVSFIVLSDGKQIVPLLPAQDHKTVFDGDEGPNTGGMGAYCDHSLLTAEQIETILDTIIRPTVEATSFTGFLYAGLMMTASGPKLLEYNIRLGDPETQAILQHLETDLAQVLTAAAAGRLEGELKWKEGASACVVLTAKGYPGAFTSGVPISGLEAAEAIRGVNVFHAGTRVGWSGLSTAGGRVLGVTASGEDVPAAVACAYRAIERIHFEGMHFRRDIGRRAEKPVSLG